MRSTDRAVSPSTEVPIVCPHCSRVHRVALALVTSTAAAPCGHCTADINLTSIAAGLPPGFRGVPREAGRARPVSEFPR